MVELKDHQQQEMEGKLQFYSHLTLIVSSCIHAAADDIEISPLHTNLHIVNFQRCKRVFHQCQVWVKLQLALHLLLLMILQLYHLPPPLPPPVSNSSCLFTGCQPLDASCTTVLFKVLYYKINNVFFIFCVCFLCIICLTVLLQYSVASCVSWIPRLTLLDLMNKVGLRMCSQNGIHLYIGDLLYLLLYFSCFKWLYNIWHWNHTRVFCCFPC